MSLRASGFSGRALSRPSESPPEARAGSPCCLWLGVQGPVDARPAHAGEGGDLGSAPALYVVLDRNAKPRVQVTELHPVEDDWAEIEEVI